MLITDKKCKRSCTRESHGVILSGRDYKVSVLDVWCGQFHPQYRKHWDCGKYTKWSLHSWCWYVVSAEAIVVWRIIVHYCHWMVHSSGFPHLLESPGLVIVKFPGPGKSRKMGLVLESPGNFSERSWKVLEFSSLSCGRRTQWCMCRSQNFQKLPQIYLYIRKSHWQPGLRPRHHSNCCLSLYLNITGIQQGPGKMLLGPWKVLEIFVTKIMGTLILEKKTFEWL